MTLYISGPMTGLEDSNYPAFNEAAARLRTKGFDVVNPAELCGHLVNATWADYMRVCIAALVQCDSIYLLPGWTESRGALLERRIAQDLGMQIIIGGR